MYNGQIDRVTSRREWERHLALKANDKLKATRNTMLDPIDSDDEAAFILDEDKLL